MTRHAVQGDWPEMMRLIREAHTAARLDQVDGFTGFHCPWSQWHIERCLTRHMRGSDAAVFVLEHGAGLGGILVAIAYEHPFGPVRLSKDTVWWIDPAARGLRNALAMLRAYEDWAASLNVTFAGISGFGDDPRVGTLLKRCGYVVADTHLIKRIARKAN